MHCTTITGKRKLFLRFTELSDIGWFSNIRCDINHNHIMIWTFDGIMGEDEGKRGGMGLAGLVDWRTSAEFPSC